MIIAINLDGSIRTLEVKSQIILKGAREFLIKAHKKGHYVKIFTSRPFSLKRETERWLKFNDMPYDELIMDVDEFDLLISDKGINFNNNWKSLKKRLSKLEKKYGKD